MLYLSCYIYSCNYSTAQEIYRALSQLRSFVAEISPPRPEGSIRGRRPFGICSESSGNGTLFSLNEMLHIHSPNTDAVYLSNRQALNNTENNNYSFYVP